MASGRLGKAYIPNSQDVAKLYEVPDAKMATFNINIVNLGSEATNVTIWITEDVFQENDFETFLSSPVITDMVDYPVSKVIGKGDYYLFLPKRGGAFQTAAPYLRYAKVTGGSSTTAGNTGEVTIGTVSVQGDIMHFWTNDELYIRQLYDAGDLYTIANFIDGGSATVTGNTWGFQATQPVQYAGTPAEATEASGSVVFYAKNNSATVGTITTNGFATSGAQTVTVYSFTAGSVQNIRPLKSGRYLLGTTGGQLYWSTNTFPALATDWAASAISFGTAGTWHADSLVDGNAPTIGLPLMMEAASSATHIYVVCTNLSGDNFVLANEFANATDTAAPVDNWELVAFPDQITDVADMTDFYIDTYDRPVVRTKDGKEYVSDDNGVTWFEQYQSGLEGNWSGVTYDAEAGFLLNSISPEMEMYRGYTYVFNQSEATNNGHPLLFSTAAEGTTSESATQTLAVTVQNSTIYDGNVFTIDGVEKRGIQLQRGGTYTFDLSDPSTASHPFALSATDDGTHNGGTAYATNFVASGAQGTEGATVTFTVPNGAPDSLYAFCASHSGMGFRIDVVDSAIAEGHDGYLGNPANGKMFAEDRVNKATYSANHANYDGEARLLSFTVPMDAPDTIYAYDPNTSGKGFSIKVTDSPAAQDNKSHLLTINVFDTTDPDAGDEMKRKEIYADGVNRDRSKQFYGLFEGDHQADIIERLGLSGGGVLERTGIVANAGEQVFVQSGGEPLAVRVHGIEE
jgi:hypothetical protein